MNIAEFYAAAADSELLTPVVFGGVTVACGFQAPDEEVLGGLMLSRDYSITYPAAQLTLTRDDALTIHGIAYTVRDVRLIGDGSECRATLEQTL